MLNKPDISNRAFWDIKFETLDYQLHRDYIITKIFDYGKWNDIVSIVHFYGKNTTIQVLTEAQHLTEQGYDLAANIFKIDKSKFRCYTQKPYRPSSAKY